MIYVRHRPVGRPHDTFHTTPLSTIVRPDRADNKTHNAAAAVGLRSRGRPFAITKFI